MAVVQDWNSAKPSLRRGLCSFRMFVLLGFLSLAAGCSTFLPKVEKPKVEIHKVTVTELKSNSAKVIFELEVENPNAFELSVDRVEYEAIVNQSQITKSEFNEQVKVAGKSSAIVRLPLNLELNVLLKSILDVLANKPLTYQIRGRVYSGLISVPVDKSGTFQLRGGS